MCHVLASAHKPAFMPKGERNLFNLDPVPMVFGELNPKYQGLLFPDTGLEKLDLTSFLDTIPDDVTGGILHHMEEVHTRYIEKVRVLDTIVKDLYSISVSLVNDGMEVTRG